MGRWDVAGIVDMETLAEVVHDVAGEAKLRRLRTVHLLREPGPRRHYRQREQRDEREHLAFAGAREVGAKAHNQRDECRTNAEQQNDGCRHRRSLLLLSEAAIVIDQALDLLRAKLLAVGSHAL